jgi:hypothetical protein
VARTWTGPALAEARTLFQNSLIKPEPGDLLRRALSIRSEFLNRPVEVSVPTEQIPLNQLNQESLAEGLAYGLRRDEQKWA